MRLMVESATADEPSAMLGLDSSIHNSHGPSMAKFVAVRESRVPSDPPDALAFFLPLLFVLSTLLFVMLLFLVCVLLLRRQRGISLRDSDGPTDVSRDDIFNDADGGLGGVEERWLETVQEDIKRTYRQAKLYETQYPPNSVSTDITLSQFLTIQEKGVSAWSFEPEYEGLPAVLVHARTELTFLPDPSASCSVQSNLPIPKLNEVYYWEVKMFDLPATTNVAVGLATKPYPTFRLPGWNRYSVAYHSNGDKCYNYPFTTSPFGPVLREGDVLGVGYRPRTGTVFFTRNGRKTEEAFTGLSRWNLFPTVGADGPCSLHVNLGQAGFVFIEANVKKWGLAPSVGTLAPPPAYGSERGSILLETGGGNVNSNSALNATGRGTTSSSSRRNHRMRRPKAPTSAALPDDRTLLRSTPLSPPPPFSPGGAVEPAPSQGIMDRIHPNTSAGPSSSRSMPSTSSARAGPGGLAPIPAEDEPSSDIELPVSSSSSQNTARRADGRDTDGRGNRSPTSQNSGTNRNNSPQNNNHSKRASLDRLATHLRVTSIDARSAALMSPESPYPVNPPTPNVSDIHLRTLEPSAARRSPTTDSESGASASEGASDGDGEGSGSGRDRERVRSGRSGRGEQREQDPPGYAVINPHIYASGVHIDLPAEVIQAALDNRSPEPSSPASPAPMNLGRGVRR